MDDSFATMGLSPQELGNINAQQIQREGNLLKLLGTASSIKRNEALNRHTEAQIAQLKPVEIEFGGKKFQTTQGSMIKAMGTLQQIQASKTSEQEAKARTQRSELENKIIPITINGNDFNVPQFAFKDLSMILADQERLNIQGKTSTRAEKNQAFKEDAIKQLEGGAEVTPEIIAKLSGLPGISSDKGATKEKERLQKVRKDWNQIFVQMNKPPESGAKNPLALANSANALGEELGESVAAVVFPESYEIPGIAPFGGKSKDIPQGMQKMQLRNPQTGALMSIGEVRQQAATDGMTLNDALMLMHIKERMRGLKK